MFTFSVSWGIEPIFRPMFQLCPLTDLCNALSGWLSLDGAVCDMSYGSHCWVHSWTDFSVRHNPYLHVESMPMDKTPHELLHSIVGGGSMHGKEKPTPGTGLCS